MSILNSTKTGLQRYAMYICNYEEFYKKTLVDCAFYDTQRAIIEMGKRQAKQQFKNRNIKKNVYLYLISKNNTTTRFKVLMHLVFRRYFLVTWRIIKKISKMQMSFLIRTFLYICAKEQNI